MYIALIFSKLPLTLGVDVDWVMASVKNTSVLVEQSIRQVQYSSMNAVNWGACASSTKVERKAIQS